MDSNRGAPDPHLLTTAEVAARLNYHRKTVERKVRAGDFPGAIRVGKTGQWRIPESALPAPREGDAA